MTGSKNANQNTRLRHLRLGFQLHTPSAGAEQFRIVGLLLFVWLLTRMTFLALKALLSGTLPLARWILFFMLINVLMNLDESALMTACVFTVMMPSAMIEVGLWHHRRTQLALRARLTRRPPLRLAPRPPVPATDENPQESVYGQ
jgi:hypothetical protein